MVKMYDEPKSPSVYGAANETMNKWHSGKCKYTAPVTAVNNTVSKARV
jgi:hypothetical protein